MAITIITSPTDVSSANNPLIITCSSDNVANANFKYIWQVYDGATLIATLKTSPRPDTYGLMNVQRIVENYVTSDFAIGEATDGYECLNSYKDIEVAVGEEYGDPIVEYPALGSAVTTILNAALKHSAASFGAEPDFIDATLKSTYMMSNLVTGANKPFLTASPRSVCLEFDQNYYLYALINVGQEPAKLILKYYDENDALLSTATKTLTGTASEVVRYGVGTKNIKLWNAAYLVGAAWYTIQLATAGSVAISELFTFRIGCECSKFNENFRLHFLNPLGGYDAHNFNKAYHRNLATARSSFQKVMGTVSNSGVFTYSINDRGKRNFNILTTETIKVNSDWLTEEEAEWMFSLVKSTDVLWEINATTFAPVTLTDVQYNAKSYAADGKLFNLELTIEIANQITSQRW